MISLSIGLFKINGKPLVSVLHLHLDTHEDLLSHYLMLNDRKLIPSLKSVANIFPISNSQVQLLLLYKNTVIIENTTV